MASQEKSSGKTLASSPRTSRLCTKYKEGVLWILAKLDSDAGPNTVVGAALPGLRNGNSIIFEAVSSIRIDVGHVCRLNINDKQMSAIIVALHFSVSPDVVTWAKQALKFL